MISQGRASWEKAETRHRNTVTGEKEKKKKKSNDFTKEKSNGQFEKEETKLRANRVIRARNEKDKRPNFPNPFFHVQKEHNFLYMNSIKKIY